MNEETKHPKRYNNGSGIECIECIRAVTFNLKADEAWQVGSAVKYLYRFQEKDPLGSLQKAIDCIQMEIDYIKEHPEQYKI